MTQFIPLLNKHAPPHNPVAVFICQSAEQARDFPKNLKQTPPRGKPRRKNFSLAAGFFKYIFLNVTHPCIPPHVDTPPPQGMGSVGLFELLFDAKCARGVISAPALFAQLGPHLKVAPPPCTIIVRTNTVRWGIQDFFRAVFPPPIIEPQDPANVRHHPRLEGGHFWTQPRHAPSGFPSASPGHVATKLAGKKLSDRAKSQPPPS